jgi:hypothetical protein
MADTATPWYALQPAALITLFSDLETFALSQAEVLVGTPGSILKRRNAGGFEFYAHQYYDALGAKRERYISGPVGNIEAERATAELQSRIDDVKSVMPSIRLLLREGFQAVDARAFAALAALHNRRLFGAGATLIGSNAFGALLNKLGVRAAAYQTEDVDIGRRKRLALAGEERPLLETLRETGIDFVAVPQLDNRLPPTSFKQRGRSTFQVELLAPARGEEIGSAPVPELEAHATTLPFLGYLLDDSQMTAVLAREGCAPVRVPLPERYAVHKFVVSELRRGRDAKVHRDRRQALVLSYVLGERYPGALRSAVEQLPHRAVKYFRRAMKQVRGDLETQHARAWDELNAR